MAFLMQTKTPEDIKKIGVAAVREYANKLGDTYERIIDKDIMLCHSCDEFLTSTTFYPDKRFKAGYFPICKKCLLKMATDYDSEKRIYVDNKNKTLKVFELLDIPFIDSIYESGLQSTQEAVGEKTKSTAYQHMLTIVKSLQQYRDKSWKDSDYVKDQTEEEVNENSRTLKAGRKRFGDGYTNSELIWLENEYQDWIGRYPCENKGQEILYAQVCATELDLDKARRAKKDTKDLTKTLQDLFTSLGIKPSQSNANALTEAKTFGELINKWEQEKPIPEPSEEFKDVDKIGLYIDVFFKGHLSKMMNLKNAFSLLYDRFISKYTVKKPEYEEDTDSEELFEQIFGTASGED